MEKLIKLLQAVIVAFLLCLIMGLPTMLLWNWLMPLIFKLPKIGFLEAVGLNLLSDIFFGSGKSSSK